MISDSVMYWASQIKSNNIFFKIITDQHNLWRFLTVVKHLKPVQPSLDPAQANIRDEIKRHKSSPRGSQQD